MISPLISRATDPDRLRREIANLKGEIENIRGKRDGAIRALSDRRQKLVRLEAQLALAGSSARVLPTPQLCPA